VSGADWLGPGRIRWAGHLHEPIYFYRGEGRTVACVDGAAEWLERWYRYARSREVLVELADLGINTLYLNFFKGYGRRFEAAEMSATSRLLALAKQFGMRTILYIQPTNFFWQFVEEVPEAADWVACDPEGNEISYGSKQRRPIVCLSRDAWIEYVADVAADAAKAGADAILLDNINHDQCCCSRCQRAFNARTGRDGATVCRSPSDPDVIEWRCRRVADLVTRIASRARQVKPDLVVAANPAFPRKTNVMLHGVDPEQMARLLDVFLIENRAFPRLEAGRPVHSSYAYHLISAAGRLAAPSVWLPPLNLPTSARQVAVQTVEPLIFGGHVVCCPWPLRPVDGAAEGRLEPWRLYFQQEHLRSAWAAALQFCVKAADRLSGARPWARLAVLHRRRPFLEDWASAIQRLLTIDAALNAAWIPYRFVFEDDRIDPEQIDAVLLPFGDQDVGCDCVRNYVAAGGQAIPWQAGDGALFDDPSVAVGEAMIAAARAIARQHPRVALLSPIGSPPEGVLHFVTARTNGVTLWLLNLTDEPVSFALAMPKAGANAVTAVIGCRRAPGVQVLDGSSEGRAVLQIDNLDVAACIDFAATW